MLFHRTPLHIHLVARRAAHCAEFSEVRGIRHVTSAKAENVRDDDVVEKA
jgi:hypothetical protein